MSGEPSALEPWAPVNGAVLAVVADAEPVSSALPNSLQVSIPSNVTGAAGVSNPGYWGAQLSSFVVS